jgi:molybdate transport system permease protein
MFTLDYTPLWISLKVAVAATAIAVVLGVWLGYLMAHIGARTRRWLESFVLLPLVLPPTVLGYYLLVIIGRRGPIGRAYESVFGEPLVFTLKAAIIAASAATVPLVLRVMSAAFASLDRQTTEAAKIDGAHGWSLFYNVHLPQVRASVTAAMTIAFARALGDFGATLMVAGNLPGKTQTASIAIYDFLNTGKDEQAMGMAIVISALFVLLLGLTGNRDVRTA